MDSTTQAEPVAKPATRTNGLHDVLTAGVVVGSSTTEEHIRSPAFAAKFSDRFLHSDEVLDECYESSDEEGDIVDDDCCNNEEVEEEGEEEFRRKTYAFKRQQEELLSDDSQQRHASRKQQLRSSRSSTRQRQHRWAHRRLYRSVSVDDLMEYQREFSLAGGLERANSANDLTDFQREFRANQAGQEHDTRRITDTSRTSSCTTHQQPGNNTEHAPNAIPLASAANTRTDRRKFLRNSISNSDLADFKRQFCRDRAANGVHGETLVNGRHIHTTKIADKNSSSNNNKHGDTDYQWGTRSLRRAVLGSDLGTFERSVRTALLETSRENSVGSLVDSNKNKNSNKYNNNAPDNNVKTLPSNGPATHHRDSTDLKPASRTVVDREYQKEDWGTRSLRKSIKEVDFNGGNHSPTPATSVASSRMPSIDEIEFDTPLGLSSPWHDATMVHVPNSNGLKMPRRLPSGPRRDEAPTGDDHDKAPPPFASITSAAPQSRSSSVNDIVLLSAPQDAEGQPEFEWQMRSRFRRSISSSDIEKYQRHLTTAMEEDSERMPGTDSSKEFGLDESSPLVMASVESAASNTALVAKSENAAHPLLSPTPWSSADSKNSVCKSSVNDDTPKKPKRDARLSQRHRHRRSTSDEPELHMENVVISDVAPRKPTRTTSRPISPPPPRPPVVRFADNNNQVVEIPKVSEDMKPFLFYTKRDVKRFRMNEHRRQEEQIRSYMEYLNQKENALDGTPSLYD